LVGVAAKTFLLEPPYKDCGGARGAFVFWKKKKSQESSNNFQQT